MPVEIVYTLSPNTDMNEINSEFTSYIFTDLFNIFAAKICL